MNSRLDQLLQLTKVTWDGDLISKTERDCLVKECLASRSSGFNVITDNGIRILSQLNLIKEETLLAAEQGEGQLTADNNARVEICPAPTYACGYREYRCIRGNTKNCSLASGQTSPVA